MYVQSGFSKWLLVLTTLLIVPRCDAMQSPSEDAAGYSVRGNIALNKKQYDQAISDYTRALEINPRLAEVYHNRGFAYQQNGQNDQAIADYSKALEINPA